MTTVICVRCDQAKLPSEFYRDSRKKNGLCSYCKVCSAAQSQKWQKTHKDYYRESAKRYRTSNVTKVRQKRRADYAKNRDKLNARRRQIRCRSYGLTEEQYATLLKLQKGLCAICRQPPTGRWNKLVIDHNHETGTVRGLLCTCCNKAIGLLLDEPLLARLAVDYLEKWKDR